MGEKKKPLSIEQMRSFVLAKMAEPDYVAVQRPSFQFYPGDEDRDTALTAVSLEAYGLWKRMLNLMHYGVPYGHLSSPGGALSVAQIAARAGIPVAKGKRLIEELERHRVFSRSDAGVIYSRRMVHDEYLRLVRAAGGPKSLENENVPRPKVRNSDIRTAERIPSKDTFDGAKDTFGQSFGVSPAVAVAVAVASTSSSAKRDAIERALPTAADRAALAALLERVPNPEAWLAEMGASLAGMAGHHHATPEQLARAIRDFEANAAEPNMRKFRRYLEGAEEAPARLASPNGNGAAASGAPAIVQRIIGFMTTRQMPSGPAVSIPKSRIRDELGADVEAAYDAVGGCDRFVRDQGAGRSYLVRDFGNALLAARGQR